MEDPLSDEEKLTLLRLAREALRAGIAGQEMPPLDIEKLPPRLGALGASFVTLTQGGQLRGCIGTLQRSQPLAEDVRQHAIDAALKDYRFPHVQPEDVDEIEIEISVLTTPQPLDYSQGEDLLHLLRPGVDGVIVMSGVRRATFLPQVWEKVPHAERFLEMLCEKAFLSSDAWRQGDLQVQTYQVESFHEIKNVKT
jgi:AmmeMemoRadiSam system protein A